MKDTLPLENELRLLRKVPISMAYDGSEDFSLWQKSAKEKLASLLGMSLFERCDPDMTIEYVQEYDNYTETKFYFQSEEDYYVPCILAVPKNTEKKPPLMICLQGHGTGMHISFGRAKYPVDEPKLKVGDRNFAEQCIERGYCALAIDQRNFGERGGNPKPTCHGPSLVALLTGRTTIGMRLWDISRALDLMETEFSDKFDKNRIYSMGNSGGGTATLYALALEERIKGGISSCAFCTFEGSIGEKNHCECNYIPGIRNFFDMAEIGGMIAPKPLVIVNGKTDGIFPIEPATYEFSRLRDTYYKASEKPENVQHVIGEEGHQFYAKLAWPVFESML